MLITGTCCWATVSVTHSKMSLYIIIWLRIFIIFMNKWRSANGTKFNSNWVLPFDVAAATNNIIAFFVEPAKPHHNWIRFITCLPQLGQSEIEFQINKSMNKTQQQWIHNSYHVYVWFISAECTMATLWVIVDRYKLQCALGAYLRQSIKIRGTTVNTFDIWIDGLSC